MTEAKSQRPEKRQAEEGLALPSERLMGSLAPPFQTLAQKHMRVVQPLPSLCVFAPWWFKFGISSPKFSSLSKAVQPFPSLSKAPGEGGQQHTCPSAKNQ